MCERTCQSEPLCCFYGLSTAWPPGIESVEIQETFMTQQGDTAPPPPPPPRASVGFKNKKKTNISRWTRLHTSRRHRRRFKESLLRCCKHDHVIYAAVLKCHFLSLSGFVAVVNVSVQKTSRCVVHVWKANLWVNSGFYPGVHIWKRL